MDHLPQCKHIPSRVCATLIIAAVSIDALTRLTPDQCCFVSAFAQLAAQHLNVEGDLVA